MARTKRKIKETKLTQPGNLIVLILCVLVFLFGALHQSGLFTIQDWKHLGKEDAQAVQDVDCTAHFINVGQGDSILILCEGKSLLVDAGEAEYGDEVVAYLQEQGVTALDYVISTHPHSDHMGGLPAVLAAFPVGTLLVPEIPEGDLPTTKTYENFLTAVYAADLTLTTAVPGTVYALGNATLTLLGPLDDAYSDLNNYSVVAQLTYGENTILLTGDMSEEAEKELLDAEVLTSVDILKVGHHGSSTSSTKKFLKAVSPAYAVIPCGDNSYNHPNEKTVERLRTYTDQIFRTDQQGTIVFTLDGAQISVDYETE